MSFSTLVKDSILRPYDQVFRTIVEPHEISNFFTSHSSAKLEQGETITWDFKDYGVSFEVEVLEIIPNKKIKFKWDASGQPGIVEIIIEKVSNEKTNIQISESPFEKDENGITKAMQQTQGWTDFICCLKAYLYTGINLRNGRTNQNK